jgi:hypothetical protein
MGGLLNRLLKGRWRELSELSAYLETVYQEVPAAGEAHQQFLDFVRLDLHI